MSRTMRCVAVSMLLSACGATGGGEAPFEMVIEASGVDAEGFDTDTGWHVTLDEATVQLSAIYLWENPPALARRWTPWDLIAPPAHAHAGDLHFNGGAVLGEHLGHVQIDLLAAPMSLGERVGNEGRVQSFTVLFEPSDELGGHVAWVKGAASKDGVTVPFEGGLALEPGRDRRVDGLVTDGWISPGATFVTSIEVPRWFRDADFSKLVDGAITPESQVRAAWFLGARSNESFVGSWRTATK